MSYMKALYEDIWECKTDLHMTNHEIAWYLNIPLEWVESAIQPSEKKEQPTNDNNQE